MKNYFSELQTVFGSFFLVLFFFFVKQEWRKETEREREKHRLNCCCRTVITNGATLNKYWIFHFVEELLAASVAISSVWDFILIRSPICCSFNRKLGYWMFKCAKYHTYIQRWQRLAYMLNMLSISLKRCGRKKKSDKRKIDALNDEKRRLTVSLSYEQPRR